MGERLSARRGGRLLGIGLSLALLGGSCDTRGIEVYDNVEITAVDVTQDAFVYSHQWEQENSQESLVRICRAEPNFEHPQDYSSPTVAESCIYPLEPGEWPQYGDKHFAFRTSLKYKGETCDFISKDVSLYRHAIENSHDYTARILAGCMIVRLMKTEDYKKLYGGSPMGK